MPKDLFEEMRKAHEEMESLFEHFLHLKRPFTLEAEGGWKPLVDVYDTSDFVVVTIELAGVSREEVTLLITKNSLTVKGTRADPAPKDGKRSYFKMEISFGFFERRIPLLAHVDPEKAETESLSGLLRVRIPKVPEKVIEIE
jgi:HSP20 family protein